jgi:hypothetical protein
MHDMRLTTLPFKTSNFMQHLRAHQVSGADLKRGHGVTGHYPASKPKNDESGRLNGLQVHAAALGSGSIVVHGKLLQAANWLYKHLQQQALVPSVHEYSGILDKAEHLHALPKFPMAQLCQNEQSPRPNMPSIPLV